MSAYRVVRDRIYERTFGGAWWGAKCRFCHAWVTKFDFSAEDALAIAEASNHQCRPGGSPRGRG